MKGATQPGPRASQGATQKVTVAGCLPAGLVLLLFVGPGHAGDIYRCLDESGTPVFSAQPCDGNSSPLVLPEIGTLPGMDPVPKVDTGRAEPQRQPVQPRGGLSFSERNRLREIEIRLHGLRRDLQGGSRRRQQEIRTQIRQLEREQGELQTRASRGYAGP